MWQAGSLRLCVYYFSHPSPRLILTIQSKCVINCECTFMEQKSHSLCNNQTKHALRESTLWLCDVVYQNAVRRITPKFKIWGQKNALKNVCYGLNIKQYYTSKGAFLLILTLQSIAILICKCDLDFFRGGHWQYTSRNLSSCRDTGLSSLSWLCSR